MILMIMAWALVVSGASNLYEVTVTLFVDGTQADKAESYFGMRKIAVEAGKLMLNNRIYFMRLVLDQGYFPEGILTAPSDEDLKRGIELAKQMGFNGARKHQKIEDPRYLGRTGWVIWYGARWLMLMRIRRNMCAR